MKVTIFTVIWTIFWLTLASTLLAKFPTENLRIDFIFLGVVALGFLKEWLGGLIPIFLVGLITDAVSLTPFGIHIFVYLTVFGIIRFANSLIYAQSSSSRIFWATFVSVVAIWLKAGVLALFYKNTQFINFAFLYFAPQAILNGVLALITIPLFGHLVKITWQDITRPKGLVGL